MQIIHRNKTAAELIIETHHDRSNRLQLRTRVAIEAALPPAGMMWVSLFRRNGLATSIPSHGWPWLPPSAWSGARSSGK